MAKDYAKKYTKYKYLTPRRKNNRYLWVMLAVSIGLFILGLFFFKPAYKEKQLAKKLSSKKNIEAPIPQLPEPKFDFYNILPQENLNVYPQQLDFSQGAAKTKQPECIKIHEDCELSGNTDKNSSAKSVSPQLGAAMKEIPLSNEMTTSIQASPEHRPINAILNPTPEQVAITEAKKQLEEEMGQFNNEVYMLLLGSFINQAYAEQLQAQALLKGFSVQKKVNLINGKPIYQVFLGPSDLNKLRQAKKRLNEAGLTSILIKITP
jgi:cell division protein FtsN